MQRGATYDGATLGSLTLDLDKLLHWPGATVFASAYQIHGRGPTQTLVANLQTVSSIEATDSFRLYDLWLEQSLFGGRVSIRFGQEGIDDTFTSPSGTSSYEFMVTQYRSLFLNSSVGFAGLAAVDLTSGGPSYPLSAPFVRVKLQASATITLLAGVYTADPAPAGLGNPQVRDLHGTAFRLNDHALTLGELWYRRTVPRPCRRRTSLVAGSNRGISPARFWRRAAGPWPIRQAMESRCPIRAILEFTASSTRQCGRGRDTMTRASACSCKRPPRQAIGT